jgi:Bacterial Ig-like domain
MDLIGWGDRPDSELEQLLGSEAELLETARRLRAARPEPRIDPRFQRELRAQLMTAAERELRPRGLRHLLRPRPSMLAYGAAAMGTGMIAVAALAYYAPHSDRVTLVQGVAAINEQHSVNPDDVIRIRFNQPMDHASVQRGLTIQPATRVTATWQGNQLTLIPTHHLQANSPYVITIPRSAARDVRGDIAGSDITITFGTRPVVPASPSARTTAPVPLAVHEVGTVGDGTRLAFTGDGALIATDGLITQPAISSASPGSSASGISGAVGSLTSPILPGQPAASAAPSAPASAALVRYGPDGPVRLGDPVAAVALSPAGHSLATVTPSGDHAVVAVSDTDGSHRSMLSTAADAGSPVGWGGDATHPVVLFLSHGQVTAVDLEGHAQSAGGLHLDPGQTVSFAPGGRYAFVGVAPPADGATTAPSTSSGAPGSGGVNVPGLRLPIGSGAAPSNAAPDSSAAAPYAVSSDTGRIVDLSGSGSGGQVQLTGLAAGDAPAFGTGGRHVAWVDRSGAGPVIDVAALDGSSAPIHVAVPGLAADDTITGLALDAAGDRVAYAVQHAGGTDEVRVGRVSDGDTLGTAASHQPSVPVFSPDGTSLAFLSRDGSRIVAEQVSAPGAPVDGASVPAAAAQAIDHLVDAEVAGDRQELDRLVASSDVEEALLDHLPDGLSRGYVISALATGDAVTAQVRLLRDPTNDHPAAAFTDETVTLTRGADGYRVTQGSIPEPLHDQPSGPQVIHVASWADRSADDTTVRLTFDSDLDPSSVNPVGIALAGAPAGATPTVTYDAPSRTLTVTFAGIPHQPLDLTVNIGLRDVNGQGMADPFRARIGP